MLVSSEAELAARGMPHCDNGNVLPVTFQYLRSYYSLPHLMAEIRSKSATFLGQMKTHLGTYINREAKIQTGNPFPLMELGVRRVRVAEKAVVRLVQRDEKRFLCDCFVSLTLGHVSVLMLVPPSSTRDGTNSSSLIKRQISRINLL